MSTFLERILIEKRIEVEQLKGTIPNRSKTTTKKRSLIDKLPQSTEIAIIAEFKRASPSKGMINNSLDPIKQAKEYKANGVSAISVLTDSIFFKGSFSDLRAIREVVDVPILCKDFILDEVQIDHAKACGADIILLIVAALEAARLKELFDYGIENDLEVLVEVHDEVELEIAIALGAQLIGINNRNLRTFEVDLVVTEKLAAKVRQSGAFLISESGIQTRNDVQRVLNAGANGILVGETLMKSGDVAECICSFKLPLQKEPQS